QMPEYEDNLLGKFDIGEGSTQLDLSALQGKLTGEYFTLVFRTENHTFYEDFDSYPVGTKFVDGTSGGDNNVADTTDSSKLHYHSFFDTVYNTSQNTVITRRNGDISDRKVISDGENNMLRVVTAGSATWGGKLKFYNSVNDSLITKDSDIVGKTLRFTAKVKLDTSATNQSSTSGIKVDIAAYTSYTQNALSEVDTANYTALSSDWTTLSVDYTVSADDIMEPLTSSGKTNYSYPIFGLSFNDNDGSASNKYLVDDLTVVEVVDGEAVGDAIFGSREAYSKDVRFVSALNGNVTILETNVSSSTTGDVFSFIDGMETHSLLTVKNGNLVFGDTVLCDEDGNDYVLGDKNIKVVAIYDDTKGTVRFAIGDYLAYYKDAEGEIHATYEHLVIDGGISENTSLGTANATLTKLNKLTSEIIGSQTHALENSVRIVSGVDTIYYNEIGFMLESDGDCEKKIGSTIVYSSVVADDKDVFAKDYGYNLMSALAIKEVKNGGVIKVTPFLRVGTNYIYGETVFYKITTSGGISITEVDESEFTAPTNANLASVTVDGEPLVGLSTDKLNYTVGVADPLSMDIVAVAEEPEATVEIAKNENTATITVTAYDGLTKKVYTVTAYEKVESSVVNKNGANAIVTYTFDDGNTDSASIVVGLADKYPSLTGSFALITNKLATLSTIEGDPDDGLLEYEFDENGDYVYTKDEEAWTYWENLFDNYGDRGFEGVSHTHTHKYIGENDNGGSFVYKNTAGESFTSAVFPIGNVRKEYYASNQILRELGQRALVMVGAGLTANGYMVDYTESYKNLPKTSGAFIGKRKTVNSPANPADMVNLASEFLSDDCRFNVKAYMVQHYATSATAPKNTSATDYSKEACMAAGVGYWTDYIDKAVEMGEWAAFCFHNVKPDTYTETGGHFVFESQADAVFSYTENLSKENKVWVANFTDACLYMFERSTAEVNAHIADNGNIVVSLDDKEDDEIFTMPLTVKVALPEGKTGAKLGETELVAFTENETVYVYVDIVPGNSATLTVE
ncbi:MAG: hypothetical protein IJW79_04850, partial [Clostridia bacterium]|nr:hypothetical protein [Clostridia bacterium]